MKLIKLLLCALCTIVLLLCCSCGLFGDKEFFCDIDTVKSIQIVKLDKYVDGEYRYEYTVLSEIDDRAEFVDRLNALKQSVNWGDPKRLDVNYVVIKINYQNDDYDLIYHNAQWFNREGVNQSGYFFFDQEQFNALISDYLTK